MGTTVATPLDFWRLAELGERRGIKILLEPISGEHFATSATNPTILYRVTGLSCTCRGFIEWQRCSHHALLLSELGWLPDPDPATPAPASAAPKVERCWECQGSGVERVCGPDGKWFEVACPLCNGAGDVEVGPGADDADAADDGGGNISTRNPLYGPGRAPLPVEIGGDPWEATEEPSPMNPAATTLHTLRGEPVASNGGRVIHSEKSAA